MGARSSEVIVVGGGLMGIATALALTERGASVTVLDRGPLGAGASGTNPGSLAVQNKPRSLVRLAIAGTDVWRELSEEYPEIGYRRVGGLRVAETEQEIALLRSALAEQRAAGLAVTFLSADDLRATAPYLSPRLLGANLCPLDGYANARLSVRALAQAATDRGARLRPHTPVVSIATQGTDFLVTTAAGGCVERFAAERVVLATGAWSTETAALLGLMLPIQHRINQVMVTVPTTLALPHQISHVRGRLTAKRSDLGTILIGGGWPGRPAAGDGRPRTDFASMRENLALAARVIPALARIGIARVWAANDGRAPDQLPVCGRVPGHERAFVMTSCFGGYTLGPLLGRLMAQAVTENRVPTELEPFAPSRDFSAADAWVRQPSVAPAALGWGAHAGTRDLRPEARCDG